MKINKKHVPFIISVLVFVLILGLEQAGLFNFLELKSYDSRMNSTSHLRRPSQDIILVIVNQQSLDEASEKYGWSFPWPREAWGKIYEYMDAGNAASVTYDILFSETSTYGKNDDIAFAEKLAEGHNTKSCIAQFWNGEYDQEATVTKPVKEILNSATLLSTTTSLKDSDDIIRRCRIEDEVQGENLVFMGFAPIADDENFRDKLPVMHKKGEYTDSVKLTFKGDINRYVRYSAMEILNSIDAYNNGDEPEYEPENFENAHIFVIYYASGIFDICSSPIGKVYPGGGISITALDNYLTDDFMRTVPYFLNLLALFLVCILGTMISVFSSKRKSTRTVIASNIILFSLGIFLIYEVNKGLFILKYDALFIPLLAGFVISFISAASVDYFMEGKQKRFIKNAFSQYLSPVVINQLISNPDNLKLGGERRFITMFFSDVESFTSLSENLSPEALTEILNIYLGELSKIILESGGTIDKYEGDAIIAFWNAPADIPDHSVRALEAAVKCQERLQEMNDYFLKKVGRGMWTRIGINTGFAVVGNMGSESRFDYTMFGDSVNLAARLEGLNKQFGTYLLCSENTKKHAEECGTNLFFREIGKVQVIGKSEAVKIFEPMTIMQAEKTENERLEFEKGLEMFYSGKLKKAEDIFSKNEKDKTSLFYAKKCRQLLDDGITGDKNWPGIFVAESK